MAMLQSGFRVESDVEPLCVNVESSLSGEGAKNKAFGGNAYLLEL
jgi:hypothetical protein